MDAPVVEQEILYRLPLTNGQYRCLESWGKRICVENVPASENIDSLLRTFGNFGLILEMKYVPQEKKVFITYSRLNEAIRAIELAEFLHIDGTAQAPINVKPSKDMPLLILFGLKEGVTDEDVKAWLKQKIGSDAIRRTFWKDNRCTVEFIAYHFAERVMCENERSLEAFTAMFGPDAGIDWKEVTWNKVVGVPSFISKEQILEAFDFRIRKSIFAVIQSGTTVYLYYKCSDELFFQVAPLYRTGLKVKVRAHERTLRLVPIE